MVLALRQPGQLQRPDAAAAGPGLQCLRHQFRWPDRARQRRVLRLLLR